MVGTHTGAAAEEKENLEDDRDNPEADDDDWVGDGLSVTGQYVADVGDDIGSCHRLGIVLRSVTFLTYQTEEEHRQPEATHL